MDAPDVSQIVRSWVREVAYAEDDFVLTFDPGSPSAFLDVTGCTTTGRPVDVITLLDRLDPQWREAFTVTANRF